MMDLSLEVGPAVVHGGCHAARLRVNRRSAQNASRCGGGRSHRVDASRRTADGAASEMVELDRVARAIELRDRDLEDAVAEERFDLGVVGVRRQARRSIS
jgi:hypothetical protein